MSMKCSYLMKPLFACVLLFIVAGCYTSVSAQAIKSLPDTSKMAYNEISKRMKLVVFPAKSQSQQKQKQDEFECYKWAADQSGVDPLNPPKVEAAPVQTGPDGSAVVGSAKGAAAGVAIGAIAGDAGKGAAIGAVAGGLAGHRKGKMKQQQAAQQSQATANSQTADIKNSYLKAFQVCMEGKGYTIK
jgi:hypothetical protein